MNAVRMHVVVPADRRLTISLPASVPPGDAEVIVLIDDSRQATDSARALLDLADEWRRAHPERRSREDIDSYLASERATWSRGE